MSITSITKKTKERVHFRKPHESYLGKKLNHCPECGSSVQLEEDDETGYAFWICNGCYEHYLYRLPLHHESERYLTTPEAERRLRKEYFGSTPTPTTTTNEIQPRPLTSATPVTPITMQESSAENTGPITFQEARDLLRKTHSHSHTKNQHTSPPSKSSEPDSKDPQTSSPDQGCTECKGKTLTVGSPVMVKLQCPDQITQRLNKLEARNLEQSRKRIDRITKLEEQTKELQEIIEPLQRGVKWVSGENLKLKRRVIALEHRLDNAEFAYKNHGTRVTDLEADNKDLRKKVWPELEADYARHLGAPTKYGGKDQ